MKKFLECLIPNSTCNLNCSYCYISQQNRKSERVNFKYNPENIGEALNKRRLGGVSYISICSSGETLLPKEITSILYHILKQGHFVNITTNGTITSRFKEIINNLPFEFLQRLHFAFSFHYLELLRTNNLDAFFQNIKLIKNAGCSFLVQINLCDEYMPYWDDIKKIVKKNVGAYPQVALTRDCSKGRCKILTDKKQEEYISIAREMNSPLFEFTLKNFMIKRHDFCYAGDWSGKLNLATGILTSCYGYGISQNIFEDISKPIKFEAIGKNCPFNFCFNSSHFMSLGVIPSISTPSYAELRNRKEAGWYSDRMRMFLSGKLSDEDKEYTLKKKLIVNIKYRFIFLVQKIKNKIFSVYRKIKEC